MRLNLSNNMATDLTGRRDAVCHIGSGVNNIIGALNEVSGIPDFNSGTRARAEIKSRICQASSDLLKSASIRRGRGRLWIIKGVKIKCTAVCIGYILIVNNRFNEERNPNRETLENNNRVRSSRQLLTITQALKCREEIKVIWFLGTPVNLRMRAVGSHSGGDLC